MPVTPYAFDPMITTYYLNPDGSLRPTRQAGHCDRYWRLYAARVNLHAQIADELGGLNRLKVLDALRAELDNEYIAVQSHREICEVCRQAEAQAGAA